MFSENIRNARLFSNLPIPQVHHRMQTLDPAPFRDENIVRDIAIEANHTLQSAVPGVAM